MPEGDSTNAGGPERSLLAQCNELGAQGWELVAAIIPAAGCTRLLFKRPVT
jgi:hypothetical protein